MLQPFVMRIRSWLLAAAMVTAACSSEEAEVEQDEPANTATDPTFGDDIPAYKEAANVPRGVEDDEQQPSAPQGKPHWDACEADGDCQSGACGCAFGEKKVCLPSAGFPKTCASPQPAPASGGALGLACSAAEQCASKVCGCHMGTKKECLPDASYSKPCASGAALGDACKADGDCSSKVCGCADSKTKKCLPERKWVTKCT